MNRQTYKLLHAISAYREDEREIPDAVKTALGDLESALNAGGMDAKGEGKEKAKEKEEGDAPDFESAGRRAAKKFRGESTDDDDE